MKAFKRDISVKGSGKFIWLLILFFSITVFSGCALFRKKNKCMDCPSWSKTPNRECPDDKALSS